MWRAKRLSAPSTTSAGAAKTAPVRRVRLVQTDRAAPHLHREGRAASPSGERRGAGRALREAVVGCGRSAVPGARQPAAVGLALPNGVGRAPRAPCARRRLTLGSARHLLHLGSKQVDVTVDELDQRAP